MPDSCIVPYDLSLTAGCVVVQHWERPILAQEGVFELSQLSDKKKERKKEKKRKEKLVIGCLLDTTISGKSGLSIVRSEPQCWYILDPHCLVQAGY